jgi:DNA gyrase inhibitor GyrI
MNPVITSFALLGLAICFHSSLALADPTPTTAPSQADAVMGDVRVQTLKGYTYAFVSTRTTLRNLRQAIDATMPTLDKAIDAGKLRPDGSVVFTYHGATGDPDQEFTLDIGVMVKAGSKAPDGFQLAQVPARTCATLLFSGSAQQLPPAYGKLYGDIEQKGLQPTDVCREVYLYWEGRASVNNILLLEADLAPAK